MLSHKIYCNTELVKKEISMGALASKTSWKSSPIIAANDIYYYNISDAITNEKLALEAFNFSGVCAVIAIAQVLPVSVNELLKHLILILIPNSDQHHCDQFLVPRSMIESKLGKTNTDYALGSQTVEFPKLYSKVRIFLLKTVHFVTTKSMDQISSKKKWDEVMQSNSADDITIEESDATSPQESDSESDSEYSSKDSGKSREDDNENEDEDENENENEELKPKFEEKPNTLNKYNPAVSKKTFKVSSRSFITDSKLETYNGPKEHRPMLSFITPDVKQTTFSPKDGVPIRLISSTDTPKTKDERSDRKSKFSRVTGDETKTKRADHTEEASTSKNRNTAGLINGNGKIDFAKRSKK